MKYEVIIENPTNAYVLDKEENQIVTLCSTKRPDRGFKKLLDLVEQANKTVANNKEEKTMIDTKINLCDTCKNSHGFPCCMTDDTKFGDGKGNDNIVECDNYNKREEKR